MRDGRKIVLYYLLGSVKVLCRPLLFIVPALIGLALVTTLVGGDYSQDYLKLVAFSLSNVILIFVVAYGTLVSVLTMVFMTRLYAAMEEDPNQVDHFAKDIYVQFYINNKAAKQKKREERKASRNK